MTVLEGIQRSADFLGQKGVESPRLQAELLLSHVLQLPRMKLYLNFERALATPEADALRELVKRRGRHEPLQHIVGSTCFCGFEIAVNRHVLIPRQETEILAERGWMFLNRLAGTVPSPAALELGTGSGCLAIALAAKCPSARLLATDISPEALELARSNARQHAVLERIEFVHGDGFAPLQPAGRFDLLISNPPYIPTAEIQTLAPEVKDFDPPVALDGGADGLDFYRRIASEAPPLLTPDAKAMVEFGDGQADDIRKIFEEQKWIVEDVAEDYTGRHRILIACFHG